MTLLLENYQLCFYVSKMPKKHSLDSSGYIVFFLIGTSLNFVRIIPVVNSTNPWRCNVRKEILLHALVSITYEEESFS